MTKNTTASTTNQYWIALWCLPPPKRRNWIMDINILLRPDDDYILAEEPTLPQNLMRGMEIDTDG
jgi:hypothetical protein